VVPVLSMSGGDCFGNMGRSLSTKSGKCSSIEHVFEQISPYTHTKEATFIVN
jgi:hypothetical protein